MAIVTLETEQSFALEHLNLMRGPFLGMDWGKKKTGLAISDAENAVAMPLKVVKSGLTLQKTLIELWAPYEIKALIIGWPLHLSGKNSALCTPILRLAIHFHHKHGWPIALWDERLSTKALGALMIDRKDHLDHHAAAVILQGALNRWHQLRPQHLPSLIHPT